MKLYEVTNVFFPTLGLTKERANDTIIQKFKTFDRR